MTNVGDLVHAVMGSDGKYYAKTSASVAVGDNVQAFIGSDGKWYASKSGNPTVGSNVLVSMDSTGKWIVHNSTPPINQTGYIGFGGGDEVVYTVWQVGTTYTIEKRNASNLRIISSSSGLPTSNFPVRLTYAMYFGGTGDKLIVLSGVYPYYTFNIYDSNNDYAFVSTITTTEPYLYGTPFVGYGIVNGIFTMFYWYYSFWYRYTKWNIIDNVLIDRGQYPLILDTPPITRLYKMCSGPENTFYGVYRDFGDSTDLWHMTSFPFLSDGTDYYQGDKYYLKDSTTENFYYGYFIGSTYGYSEVIPYSVGADECQGYSWDPITLVRTTL